MPNIAIMQISTYHKRLGDDVDWYSHLFDHEDTDILYISKLFDYTRSGICLYQQKSSEELGCLTTSCQNEQR